MTGRDYVTISKAIHDIYEMRHGQLLKVWEAKRGPIGADNRISVQEMRVELVRELATPPSDTHQRERGVAPLPIDAELRDVIDSAKRQIAGWGYLSGKGPPREFKPVPLDLLVTRDDAAGRNLAHSISQAMNLGPDSYCLSQDRRLIAITLIHALDEIDRLRAIESASQGEDSARLDWLRSGGFVAGPVDHTGDYVWKWDASTVTGSLRQAIDAAKKHSSAALPEGERT